MLPVNRMYIFWSKALVFLLAGFSYIAFVYLMLHIDNFLLNLYITDGFFKVIPPIEILMHSNTFYSFPSYNLTYVFQFIGVAFVSLTVFFLANILKRCYGFLGVLGGIGIIILYLTSVFYPLTLTDTYFTSEIAMMLIGIFTVWFIGSLIAINYLLKSKVTV